ncbi:helix-turn-helix domain-containing protein [Paenibacillus spongiae]|uniref:MerR family transcriptional regulator n=1 Tax=Paenibacillus spongiae TaxID=2909671 RepID=A0ABY5SI59_9BACL|nr:MerR family transcriptional regulator [Paenibacillus spongiae]UVI33248.1 MerR family transcriptional regulator [Paenibacillus spongiae]
MERSMTIQIFSDRTGLPPSTLRYYEKESLLVPHIRGDNGYRLYTEEQIPVALTIHSLRQADVNLREIRSFLSSGDTERIAWVRKWRDEIDAKMASMRIAKQYLQGMESDDQHLRLVKWESAITMLWFPLRVTRRLNPYAEAIEERAAYLYSEYGIRCNEAFVKAENADGDEMIGQVGFRLPKSFSATDEFAASMQGRVERIQPTLFVTLACMAADAFACFNLMLLVQRFGFEPTGPKLERYELSNMAVYQWMIPVMHADPNQNRSIRN